MIMDQDLLRSKFDKALSYAQFVKLGESQGHRLPWDHRYDQLALAVEQEAG